MKNILIIFILFGSLDTFAAPVKLTGFALGWMIGDPTAFSFKGHLGNDRYFDFALAYNVGPADGVYMHGDYLIERPEMFQIDNEVFNFYYGIGARSYIAENKRNKDEFYFGARVPVGISYYFKKPSVEAFAEAAAVMDIIPETSADIDFSIGARYWF